MVRSSFAFCALGVALMFCASPAEAQPVNGFPNWEERVLHQWINRARVAPSVDLAGCGSNCSPAEMAASCYTPMPPLMWDHELSVAARFHSASQAKQGFFGHNTPCTLRSDLSDVYPSTCDGSAACSCSGSGSTGPATRVGRFGGSYTGEIIAAGYGDPVSAIYGWLHEPVNASAGCAFTNNGPYDTNGHRYLILKSTNSLGSGYAEGGTWRQYYTTNFGRGGTVLKLPSGAHYPRQGSSIEFWANWYDTQPPTVARVVIGAVSYPMILGRGTTTNGAWTATVNGLGTGCHRYYFEFLDSSGTPHRQPATGTYGIGSLTSCADWQTAEIPAPTLSASVVSTLPASVQVSWTSSPGATQYQVERSAGGVPFAPLATVAGTGYVDATVSSGETYLYRVRPVGGSTPSNTDHVTVVAFTDDPLIANVTPIRTLHLTEIRNAVNAAREAAGLGPASWTDGGIGSTVKATHILELRNALSQALTAFGRSAAYTYPATAGSPPRALDFQELRDALK
jgi:hypothetical protein